MKKWIAIALVLIFIAGGVVLFMILPSKPTSPVSQPEEDSSIGSNTESEESLEEEHEIPPGAFDDPNYQEPTAPSTEDQPKPSARPPSVLPPLDIDDEDLEDLLPIEDHRRPVVPLAPPEPPPMDDELEIDSPMTPGPIDDER